MCNLVVHLFGAYSVHCEHSLHRRDMKLCDRVMGILGHETKLCPLFLGKSLYDLAL